MPPPQFYELSRLTNFKDVDVLQKFAADRSTCGSEEYLPHLIQTDDDGLFSILPGNLCVLKPERNTNSFKFNNSFQVMICIQKK